MPTSLVMMHRVMNSIRDLRRILMGLLLSVRILSLSEFLVSLSDNYQHFLFGTRTNNTESFHFVCNQYYTKGLTVSFDTYKKRKYFAGLHWNEKKSGVIVEKGPQQWQKALMNRYVDTVKVKTVAVPTPEKRKTKRGASTSLLNSTKKKKKCSNTNS